MLKTIVVAMSLVCCMRSLAAGSREDASPHAVTIAQFAGVWLVVPRAAPDKISPGGIPRAFLISKQGASLQGIFQWNGQSFGMKDFSIKNNVLNFKLEAENSSSWIEGPHPFKMLALLSEDRQQIDVWIGEQPKGEAPFLARRVTPKELAAVVQAAPKVDEWKKQSLPPLRDVPANGLARRPPMGWNSWNVFREAIDDRTVREMADALVSSGLRDAGYDYINIDDGWQGHRDANGVLHPNKKFPNMKALVDYVHARGLKFGLYSSPGLVTCAGYLGSHGHEEQDAKTFAQWGVDLLKYDWCFAAMSLYKTQPEMQALFQKMGEALQATGRPIVYSLCNYGLHDVGSWGRKVGGNLWRTGGDSIEGNLWSAIDHRFDKNGNPEHAGPGGWNDADMMLIGLNGLTDEEYRTHFALWAMSASPIVLGNDLRAMSAPVKAILMNREVLAIDQDALGVQGRRVVQKGSTEVWTKPLSDGSTAVALFNRGNVAATVEVRWSDLGLSHEQHVRDLWTQRNLGRVTGSYKVDVPFHGSILLNVAGISKKASNQ